MSTFADRVHAARVGPEALLHQMAPKTLLCVMPRAAYGARISGNTVTVTLLATDEAARYVFEARADGRVGLPQLGHWADVQSAARDLVLLAAHEGLPADLEEEA